MARITKTDIKTLLQNLTNATNEKDVENAWRSILTTYYVKNNDLKHIPAEMSSPYNTDGYITRIGFTQDIRLLLEFKDTYDFSNIKDLSKVVAQVVYYLRAFQQNEPDLPTIILMANRSQAVVLYAPVLYKYLGIGDISKDLGRAIDELSWSKTPSSAKEDRALCELIEGDTNVKQAYVYTVSETGVQSVFDEIDELIRLDIKDSVKIPINIDSIKSLFELFVIHTIKEDLSYIIGGVVDDEVKKKRESIVGVFMQLLQGNPNYYLHPIKTDILVADGLELSVYGDKLTAFFAKYDRNLTMREIKKLTSIADELIEEGTRREHGDFWTPPHLAKRADEIMMDAIAPDYKQTSLIWDSAAGGSNLTRDFVYSNLWISTYHQWEIDLGAHYNPEASGRFQYDFLNDDVEIPQAYNFGMYFYKMPEVLHQQLEDASRTGKRVIFYTNPPYGRAGNMSTTGSKAHKVGISDTKIGSIMRKNTMGLAGAELYVQYMYRICQLVEEFQLSNVYISFFQPEALLSAPSYWRFNQYFFSKFEHVKGSLYSIGNFQGTSDTWGVMFSIYKLRDSEVYIQDHIETTLQIEEFDAEGQLKVIGSKTQKTTDDSMTLNQWVKGLIDVDELEINYPYIEKVYQYKPATKKQKLLKGSLGFVHNSSNDLARSKQYVWVYSGVPKDMNGFNVVPNNFNESVVTFAVRRVSTTNIHTWYTDALQYSVPDTSIDGYDDFVNNCLVYSLFDEGKALQVSYRNFGEYSNCGINGRWVNQWFWLLKDEVQSVVEDERGALTVARDILPNEEDRYVALQIRDREFSSEAQLVLTLATKLYYEMLPYRDQAVAEYPEFSFSAWDIGYDQLKKLVREYDPNNETFVQLRGAIKELGNQVLEGAYKHKMLSKVELY